MRGLFAAFPAGTKAENAPFRLVYFPIFLYQRPIFDLKNHLRRLVSYQRLDGEEDALCAFGGLRKIFFRPTIFIIVNF